MGADDDPVIEMNRDAQRRMSIDAALEIVPGASHLFEEPGTLEHVAELARAWFDSHLTPAGDEAVLRQQRADRRPPSVGRV